MPTPIEILLDPISLTIFAIFAFLILWEKLAPGRKLVVVKGWLPRAVLTFVSFFYLSTYLPLIWDNYLMQFQVFELSHLGLFSGTFIGVLVYELVLYSWHRTMHNSKKLWKVFHQMHHSVERLDVIGSFYLSPLDMIGFTFVSSLSLTVIVGLNPEVVTLFIVITTFLGLFQHSNVKTPHWLGYFIQRPESHTIHHRKGYHRSNYCDLPLIDMIFGTFENPKNFGKETGYYNGASARIVDMLLFRDVSKPIKSEESKILLSKEVDHVN